MESRQKIVLVLSAVFTLAAASVFVLATPGEALASCSSGQCSYGGGCYSTGACAKNACDGSKAQKCDSGTWGDCENCGIPI